METISRYMFVIDNYQYKMFNISCYRMSSFLFVKSIFKLYKLFGIITVQIFWLKQCLGLIIYWKQSMWKEEFRSKQQKIKQKNLKVK